MENQGFKGGKSIGYAETVKGNLINALVKGNSILQKDRSGICYAKNAVSGTVYPSINQLNILQFMEDNGFTNPLHMTRDQIYNKGFKPKKDQMSAVISYYARDGLRYHYDVYPTGEDGKADRSKAPIHKKGELKRDEAGNPIVGTDYNLLFNVQQIDTTLTEVRKKHDKDIGPDGKKWYQEKQSDIFEVKKTVDLPNPFPNTSNLGAEKYVPKDDSVEEILKGKLKEFFHSIYSGDQYKAWNPTKEQIAKLETHIKSKTSPLFQIITDAYFLGTGNIERHDKIQTARANRKERTQSQSM